MTPDRANYLLTVKSEVKNMKGFREISVGSVGHRMTEEEINFVNCVWNKMNGAASMYDALLRISRGRN